MARMKPKTILFLMAAACLAAFIFFPPNRLTAQSDLDTPVAAALLQDIQTQQATLADNQKQIDDKLAAVGEAVRQARIFVSRGGK